MIFRDGVGTLSYGIRQSDGWLHSVIDTRHWRQSLH